MRLARLWLGWPSSKTKQIDESLKRRGILLRLFLILFSLFDLQPGSKTLFLKKDNVKNKVRLYLEYRYFRR